MHQNAEWIEGLPVAVTVTDAEGTIIEMNARSRETFVEEGGGALVGQSVFDCHPEPSRSQLREMYRTRTANHYTIEKAGQRKVIHQMPWIQGGHFGGFVEISIPIPPELPHFVRD